jgi:YjbE family integral membrane protein
MMDSEFWLRLGGIILIDLTLAGDNALVIALAVRTLPPRLRLLGRIWGTAGAIVLRVAFIFVAIWLLALPFLQAAGGVMLIWIAIKLVKPQAGGSEHGVRQAGSLREAIWVIIVADAAMSLDNVLAVAATAQGEMLLVVIGIALSLPLVVFGSAILSMCMERWPWIIWLGGGVLGYVAGDMIMRDVGQRWLNLNHGWSAAVALLLGAIIAVLGWWYQRSERSALPEGA